MPVKSNAVSPRAFNSCNVSSDNVAQQTLSCEDGPCNSLHAWRNTASVSKDKVSYIMLRDFSYFGFPCVFRFTTLLFGLFYKPIRLVAPK